MVEQICKFSLIYQIGKPYEQKQMANHIYKKRIKKIK